MCEIGRCRANAPGAGRAPVDDLVKIIQSTPISDHRFYQAVDYLKKIAGAKTAHGFRVLSQSGEFDEGKFVGLMYFADQCDPESLKVLNDHWWQFTIPSYVWEEAVFQFGNCQYRPATSNLVKALNAASLNVVDAALFSLKKMYPDGPKETETPVDTMKAWTEWLQTKNNRAQ
jgi:hypothetical protein